MPRFLGADNIAVIANTFTIISAAAADEIILPTTNIEKFGATAIMPLPMINISNVHNNTGLDENGSLI